MENYLKQVIHDLALYFDSLLLPKFLCELSYQSDWEIGPWGVEMAGLAQFLLKLQGEASMDFLRKSFVWGWREDWDRESEEWNENMEIVEMNLEPWMNKEWTDL